VVLAGLAARDEVQRGVRRLVVGAKLARVGILADLRREIGADREQLEFGVRNVFLI
jgi:hypothetical protein